MTERPDSATDAGPLSGYAARLRTTRDADPTPQRAQARRLATAMRDVIEQLVATKAPAGVLEAAAAELESIADSLDGYPRGHNFEGFADGSFGEASNSGDPHAFFDHSPLIGLANPLAPPLQLEAVDGRVVGRAWGIRVVLRLRAFGSDYDAGP